MLFLNKRIATGGYGKNVIFDSVVRVLEELSNITIIFIFFTGSLNYYLHEKYKPSNLKEVD